MGLSVSGLGSGIDWQSILDKLREVETNKVTMLTNQKTKHNAKLSAWQTFSGKISALQTAASELKKAEGFNIFTTSVASSSTVAAGSLLSATASSSAAKGSYQVVVNNTAQVEKLASGSYQSQTSALNVSGTILVNGKAVQVEATDTLQNLRTKINATNSGTSASGVTAGIIQESPNSFRLVLTSGTEGAEGISLQNGSSSDTLAELGFNSTGTVIKNAITGGAQSDAFSSSSTAVETLLGSASQNLSGTVQINGKPVAIDLSDNLETIKDDLVAAGIAASIAPETSGTTTKYRLKIEGVTSWEDQNNVLQSLGVIEGRRDDQVGLTSGVANTVEGSGPITADTKLVDIYGYLNHAAGDKISISGNRHDGTAVAAEDFMIDATTTVGDLLGRIEDVFGNVSAGITSEGKIQILDNAGSGSQLSVALDTTLTGTDAGTLDFGSFGQVGTVRKFVLQQGTDASFSVDGLAMTSSSNSVTNAVPGLSLNLLGSDPNTTLTVNVDRDEAGLEQKVNGLLNAYNDVIGYINNQMSYNADAKTTGGPLFGDNVLKSIKIKLQTSMTAKVGTSSIKYMADLGVRIGSDNKLSLDSTTFKDALATNFDDVVKLFTDSGSSADGSFQFAYSGRASLSGTYTVSVSQIAGEGQSIAGLIDGLTATGEGNILSLSGSGSGADGLGIRYTGSTVPTSATFSFTRGIASLLESQAYRLGDSVDGAVILQQNALQANMDALDKKISAQETLIEQKMALLKTQFENMDSALTQLQSMQTFLSSLTTTTS